MSWVKADRTVVRYVGRETGVAGDFRHRFVVCIEECRVEDELNRGLLRLWELRIDGANLLWANARKTPGGWTIHFQHRHEGRALWVYDDMESLILGRRYAVEVQRTGDKHRLIVLDEETDAVYVDSGEIQGLNLPFCWIRVASTIVSRRNNGNWSTGYIENLKITPGLKP
ncbi:MAG: hypothetical protein V3S09_05415 [Candidatus Bathyarchaeia archaeon]